MLGFDSLEMYKKYENFYIGALIGRFANRIADGTFSIKGITYKLNINEKNRGNTLHGGSKGFHNTFFESFSDGSKVTLKYLSPDGESGFPGNLEVEIIYTVEKDSLTIEFFAVTDKPTPVNFTHHSYFNLDSGENILDHCISIDSDYYTPVNEDLIPTGEVKSVENSYFDLRKIKKLRDAITDLQSSGLGGFDVNYVLKTNQNIPCAVLYSEKSGIQMEIYTTQPGLQLYTGQYLTNILGKYGKLYGPFAGICLEPQNFPNAPNQPNFPSALLKPKESYYQKIVYRFSTR